MNAEDVAPRPGAVPRRLAMLVAVALIACAALAALTTARASAAGSSSSSCTVAPPPLTGPAATDSFYQYTGSQSLCDIAPGTVLKTRTELWHVASIPLPVTVVQLLYRTTNAQGQADANVTSVLLPLSVGKSTRLVGYGSYYDSLNPEDEPSVTFDGSPYSSGTELTTIETTDILPLLLAGDTVSVADTEGQTADFAAGPEYGYTTLDGLRAALSSPATNLSSSAKVALMGYSGGAIATGWAAQEAPSYAPDIESRLVGATMGGVFVDPDHNLHYIEGSSTWAGVMPMAIDGIARAYDINFQPYLSAYGMQVTSALEDDNINEAEDDYAGITWPQIASSAYPEPEDVPAFVNISNQLIMGSAAQPQVPMLIAQGAGGTGDGTQPSATYGPGDGVMVTGDVRSYAREVCATGDAVDYQQFNSFTHEETEVPWLADSLTWLAGRFAGTTAADNCSSIAPGNSLAPTQLQ